ncbi:3-deoxy-7-phosphoheptulonate synthase [bacterium K02(2017)]|nr:3-deoxy-7-phosphoheptulonate synthase [bacterium K02(2017)]
MQELRKILNINIEKFEELITPDEINQLLPISKGALHNVVINRQCLHNILDERDNRHFFVVGPCSIHDPKAALDYAKKLKDLSQKVSDKFLIIMRVYFEKPRTTIGWKGLINDPHLDDSFQIEEGIKTARKLLIDINELELATGTEALDPISPQYLAELITWSAIGARTTESQTHRELASGLSMPIGFKNGTDGSIQVAINALQSVTHKHHFLGMNSNGKISKFSTRGNPYSHIVLRGGGGKTNYDKTSIKDCEDALIKNNLRPKIVIDCSHANSNKDHNNQPKVLADGISQIKAGNKSIVGFMIESNLYAGNQKLTANPKDLKYGVSLTDKCVDWDTTEEMILDAYQELK